MKPGTGIDVQRPEISDGEPSIAPGTRIGPYVIVGRLCRTPTGEMFVAPPERTVAMSPVLFTALVASVGVVQVVVGAIALIAVGWVLGAGMSGIIPESVQATGPPPTHTGGNPVGTHVDPLGCQTPTRDFSFGGRDPRRGETIPVAEVFLQNVDEVERDSDAPYMAGPAPIPTRHRYREELGHGLTVPL